MDIFGHSAVAYDNFSKIDKNPGLISKIYKFLYILCSTSPEKLVQNAYRVVSTNGIVPCITRFSILVQNVCLDSRIPESSGEGQSIESYLYFVSRSGGL